MADRDVDAVVERIRSITGAGPCFLGLDGRSGAGKSTLASAVAGALAGTHSTLVIEGDDFYAGGSGAVWDARSAVEKADRVIDWRRQHEVLTSLRSTGRARWQPFDWESDDWDGDPAPLLAAVDAAVTDVVLLEGVYSCRPELHDLLDLRVLLATPDDERRRRLLGREGDDYRDDWEVRWTEAEDVYFGEIMPPDRFELVL